jgi:hypothetical protein
MLIGLGESLEFFGAPVFQGRIFHTPKIKKKIVLYFQRFSKMYFKIEGRQVARESAGPDPLVRVSSAFVFGGGGFST